MNYLSTRDKSLKFSFKDIFLRGLAPGGGLFLPNKIKKYNQDDLKNLSNLNYNELATEIILNFCPEEIKKNELSSLIKKSYSCFKDDEVVNLKKATGEQFNEFVIFWRIIKPRHHSQKR